MAYSSATPPATHGIQLKKRYGQHFLRQQSVVDTMLAHVELTPETSVLEIGPGDGFLTNSILKMPIKRLWEFEIDPEWAAYIVRTYQDSRITMFQENFLDVDFSLFECHKPWTVLSNLPYQVALPILYLIQRHRELIHEGVVMVQEEVAQKIVKTSGRGYGFVSLFLQYYFEWKLLIKIPPTAFYPPPKVYSRLLYFKPRRDVQPIANEPEFWKFIKVCFHQPRRTLKNNLSQTQYNLQGIPDSYLKLRAQELSIKELLQLWQVLTVQKTVIKTK